MGLFGGFKAKFTKDSKVKDKSQNNVVILKYHSYSEFDTTYHPGPSTNNIKENGVIHNNPRHKQRPPVHSAIFEDSINDKLNSIQKSLSLNNIVAESNTIPLNNIVTEPNTIPSVSTSRKGHELKSSTQQPKITEPSKITELSKNTESPSSSYHVVLPNTPPSQKLEEHKNDDEINIKKSRRKAPNVPLITEDSQTISGLNLQQNNIISKTPSASDSRYYEDESELQEQSTLIFMTQQKSVTESDAAISGTHEYLTEGYNDHEFKVNVVQHDSNRTRSFSEDEISDAEEELTTSFNSMGYSSQAASIFFGSDMMQPVITRPRRFIMMDDNEDKGGDHHETDDEADC